MDAPNTGLVLLRKPAISMVLGASAFLLLAACRPSIPDSNYPTEDAATEAMAAWRADESLPSLDSCDRDHLRILTQVPEDQFRDLCHRCGVGQCSGQSSSCPAEYQAYGCAGACVAMLCDDAVLRCDPRYIVTVHEGARDVRTTIYQELVHWLSECSGHDERGDQYNEDCRLWGMGGVAPRLGVPTQECGGDP